MSITDEAGFANGNLLADWAGRAVPAPPRIVCERALFALAAPRMWRALLRIGMNVRLRFRDTTSNPVVHRDFPRQISPSPGFEDVMVTVQGRDVADALIRQVESLLPPAEDILGLEPLRGDRSGVVVLLRRDDDRFESRPRLEVLAWALGLDGPVVEYVSSDVVAIACFGDHDRVLDALAMGRSWQQRVVLRRELFLYLDSVAGDPAPPAPLWDTFADALDSAGINWEGDDRQEEPSGDRATVRHIDLGEDVAYRFLMWEFPYNDRPPGWLGDQGPDTQARFLRALEWARLHPAEWSPQLIQQPMAESGPWDRRMY